MHRPSRGGNSGRFADRQLGTGCTALYRATEAGDMEVIRALLAKGANPNINDMGFTPFLVAAGVDAGCWWRRRCAQHHASGFDDPTRRRCECSGHRHEVLLHADLLQSASGQRRDIGSPRSGAGGPDGPGSLPSGERRHARTRRCQRQEADRSARYRGCWRRRRRSTRPRRSSGARCGGPNTAGRGAGGRGGAGGAVNPATAAEIRALLRDAASSR